MECSILIQNFQGNDFEFFQWVAEIHVATDFIKFYQNNVLQIKGCIKIYDNKICIFPDLVNFSTAADNTHPSPMVDIDNISSPCLVIYISVCIVLTE